MKTIEKVAAALELLPEELREPAVAYLLEQGEKFRGLEELIAEDGRPWRWALLGMESPGLLVQRAEAGMIDGRMDVDEEFQR